MESSLRILQRTLQVVKSLTHDNIDNLCLYALNRNKHAKAYFLAWFKPEIQSHDPKIETFHHNFSSSLFLVIVYTDVQTHRHTGRQMDVSTPEFTK